MNNNQRLICVIGGGSAGLAAIKECLAQQLNVICYEKTEHIGGLWRYREDDIDDLGSIPKLTTINTSKEMSAFSDFVPPDNFPNYMDHEYMTKYFEMYAEHYDLVSKIKFNHEVLNVAFNEDYENTGKWKVTFRSKNQPDVFKKIFDGVMICSGHHVKPNMATFPGQEIFKGKVTHTRSYKTSHGFKDKVAVVVGIGNSGCDAAVELSKVCKQVYLVARSGSWIQSRVNHKGYPQDIILTTRFISFVKSLLPYNMVCSLYERYANSFFDHEMYGLKPKHRIMEQHPTANDAIASCILSGKILIRKNIKNFTINGVIFEEIDKETKVDTVVLATGYDIAFPFIDESIISVHKNKVELFKNQFQPKLKHPNTLAVVGLLEPTGGVAPVVEMQTRWFALLMTGKIKLPQRDEMLRIMKNDIKAMESLYYSSARHTIQVDYMGYLDEIASFIGCKPNLLRYAFTDPKLFYALFFGPSLPYQYRLTGPNTWNGARDAILQFESRLRTALKA